MTSKALKKILNEAPDENASVFIPAQKAGIWEFTTVLGHSFDDNNDIQLYEINK